MKQVNLRWWASFALFTTVGFAWVLATPIFAAPDEPAHVVRATSVGRGELLGRTPVPPLPDIFASTLEVTAPGIYQGDGNVSCLTWKKNITADCLRLSGPGRDVPVNTYVGHHPPAYYGVVGILSRPLEAGEGQVLLMRALGLLGIAALLASSLETLRRTVDPVWAGTGLALAVSPMVLFLAGTVNPSGVEIAAAIGVWVHGAVLAKEAPGKVDPRLIDRLGIAAAVLILSRALSPLWLGVIGVVLLVLTTRAGALALARARRLWVWGAALGTCVAVQAWWFFYARPLDHLVGTPVDASLPATVRVSFTKSGRMLREMVGVFGWLDTPAPDATFFVWVIALAGVAVVALVVGSPRLRVALVATIAATVVLPVVIESAGASESGFIWQGRYTLPLAVGIPILAGLGAGSGGTARRLGRRLAPFVVGALAIAQVLAFGQALRRYAVGLNGPLWFFGDARWEPPVAALPLILGFGVAVVATLWWIVIAPAGSQPGGEDRNTPRADAPSTEASTDGAPVTV